MVAGLQGHIGCCPVRCLSRSPQGIHLSMWLASFRMIALSNDLPGMLSVSSLFSDVLSL